MCLSELTQKSWKTKKQLPHCVSRFEDVALLSKFKQDNVQQIGQLIRHLPHLCSRSWCSDASTHSQNPRCLLLKCIWLASVNLGEKGSLGKLLLRGELKLPVDRAPGWLLSPRASEVPGDTHLLQTIDLSEAITGSNASHGTVKNLAFSYLSAGGFGDASTPGLSREAWENRQRRWELHPPWTYCVEHLFKHYLHLHNSFLMVPLDEDLVDDKTEVLK